MFIAALLFFSSSIWGSVGYIVVAAILCLKNYQFNYFRTSLFKIILLIGLLSIVNYILTFTFNGGQFLTNNSSPVPYGITLIFSYIIACSLNLKNLKWLLFFILIDIGVAIIEYIYGVNSFWNIHTASFEEGSDLLYFKRSCGLDPNSSILGLNILMGLIILYIIRSRYTLIFIVYMLIGIFCSFNRSVIMASIPLIMYFSWDYLKKQSYFIKIIISICLIIAVIWISKTFLFIVLEQFLRGSSSFDIGTLSHRDEIWKKFIDFFFIHPLNGNGSIKLLLSNGWHAHNSYIWVLASNGIIIASLYYLYTLAYINRQNFIPIISILICSTTQSAIYWGLSVPDILLLYLIVNYNKWPYSYNLNKHQIIKKNS